MELEVVLEQCNDERLSEPTDVRLNQIYSWPIHVNIYLVRGFENAIPLPIPPYPTHELIDTYRPGDPRIFD